MELIDVNVANVEQYGFFCCMSKRKSSGYKRKLNWLCDRFNEGMKLKILDGGERGFIEYIPGENAWRAVHADGYMLIHCIWVVGQSKGKGFGKLLLDECINDAKKIGMNGVAIVTSEHSWLAKRKLFGSSGFKSVAKAHPSFELMVLKFKNDSPTASFAGDFEVKAGKFNDGLTVFRTNQCPYIEDATNAMLDYSN